jgi:pimeloyl-ACP methyl ester carboxylesterase
MSTREAVIVSHGLWMNGAETYFLRQRLTELGPYDCHPFSYRSTRDNLGLHAEQLLDFAATIDADVIHFAGHSLGGLLTLHALQTRSPANTGRIVVLGSPLVGCRAGRHILQWPIGDRVLGSVVAEALDMLPMPPWDRATDLGVIAGTLGHGLGHFFAPVEAPHDGTIAVAETRLAGASDHIELPVSHTGMLFSQMVAEQVAGFFANGRFDHG